MLAKRRAQALADAEDALDYARREGRHEGPQQGRHEGLQEGAAGLLEGQLIRKFGPLPAEIVLRLQQADTEQIHAWSLNLLDAQSLTDVFGLGCNR